MDLRWSLPWFFACIAESRLLLPVAVVEDLSRLHNLWLIVVGVARHFHCREGLSRRRQPQHLVCKHILNPEAAAASRIAHPTYAIHHAVWVRALLYLKPLDLVKPLGLVKPLDLVKPLGLVKLLDPREEEHVPNHAHALGMDSRKGHAQSEPMHSTCEPSSAQSTYGKKQYSLTAKQSRHTPFTMHISAFLPSSSTFSSSKDRGVAQQASFGYTTQHGRSVHTMGTSGCMGNAKSSPRHRHTFRELWHTVCGGQMR
eukprot:scaffold10_cov257-Pinguiococcus_pyrenoidosus.AAC.69